MLIQEWSIWVWKFGSAISIYIPVVLHGLSPVPVILNRVYKDWSTSREYIIYIYPVHPIHLHTVL